MSPPETTNGKMRHKWSFFDKQCVLPGPNELFIMEQIRK